MKSIVIGIVFDKIFFYTSNRLVLLPISQFSRDKQLRNSPPLPFNIQPLPMRAPALPNHLQVHKNALPVNRKGILFIIS